jgi:uncharacterized protein
VARSRRATVVRRVALALVTVAALGYVGVLGYLRVNERAFIFKPESREVAAPSPQFALNERRVAFPSSDDVTLTGWIVPAAKDAATAPWMLICHGNFGNIGYGQRPEFYAFMRDLGLNLLAFDYRGYGASTGEPDERGFYADASAAYEFLMHQHDVAASRLVIFGHSLGTGVAIELASRVPAAALVVDASYTSVVDRAQELYPLLPVRLVATQRFPSLDRIGSIRIPKLFLHSPEDAIIPFAHGQRLFAAASDPKQFVAVKGGHEFAYRVDKARYYGAIADLLRAAGLQ